jgi:hypothetical protein
MARQTTLEKELRSVLVLGEETKIFINPDDGIWFGGIMRHKGGRIFHSKQPNKQEIEHASMVNKMLNPPPKKCAVTQQPLSTANKENTQPNPSVPQTLATPSATSKLASLTPLKVQEEFNKH